MIIIVEGIDRTGKSTIVKELSKRLHIPIIKVYDKNRQAKNGLYDLGDKIRDCGFKMNDFFEDIIVTQTLSQLHGQYISAIMDRSLPSADVYRAVRKEKRIDIELIRWWWNKLRWLNSCYVYVSADWGFIKKAFSHNDEKLRYKKSEYVYMDQIFNWYYRMATEYKVPKIKIKNYVEDWNNPKSAIVRNVNMVINKVMK